jgi:hypothetical protein
MGTEVEEQHFARQSCGVGATQTGSALAGQAQAALACRRETLHQALGPFQPTPHGEAVQRTVEWFRRRNQTMSSNGRVPQPPLRD